MRYRPWILGHRVSWESRRQVCHSKKSWAWSALQATRRSNFPKASHAFACLYRFCWCKWSRAGTLFVGFGPPPLCLQTLAASGLPSESVQKPAVMKILLLTLCFYFRYLIHFDYCWWAAYNFYTSWGRHLLRPHGALFLSLLQLAATYAAILLLLSRLRDFAWQPVAKFSHGLYFWKLAGSTRWFWSYCDQSYFWADLTFSLNCSFWWRLSCYSCQSNSELSMPVIAILPLFVHFCANAQISSARG